MVILKRISDFNDFLGDRILESLGTKGIMPLMYSEKFAKILMEIDHPIADELQMADDSDQEVTLIDVTDKNDLVSMSTSPKIIEFLMSELGREKEEIEASTFYKFYKNRDDVWTKYRTTIKIGKFVKKILEDKYPDNGQPGEDIESFVNAYKIEFDKSDMSKLFELVSGNGITRYYQKGNYASGGDRSTLYNSCMNDEEDFLRFYAYNVGHVQMLILFEDDRKSRIVGRALVWTLDIPEDRIYMDRIYTIHDYQQEFFIEYAKKNKWLYKSQQTYGQERINDPINGRSDYMELTVKNIKLASQYPYLDTLQYLDQDKKILSSEKIGDYVKLTDTSGEAYDCQYSEHYDRWININNLGRNFVICTMEQDRYSDEIDNIRRKEDAVYLDYYSEWISKDKYDKKIIKATIPKDQDILKDDAVYLKGYGGWAHEDYVDRNLEYSEYEDDHFEPNDLVFSKTLDSYVIADKSTDVYTDETKEFTDYIPDKELDKYTYTKKGDYFLKKDE